MARQINLLNPAFRRQKRQFSAIAMAQGLALMAVAVVLLSIYLGHRVDRAAATLKAADASAAAQREQLVRLAGSRSPQERSKLVEAELGRALAQLESRQELLDTLRTEGLGSAAGFSPYLAALARQSMAGVWLTAVSIDGDGNQLALEGRVLHAGLVPAYLRALGQEEMMRGRQISSLKLTAREQPAATPPAAAPAVQPQQADGPSRYVEFSLLAPRTAPPAAQKGSS